MFDVWASVAELHQPCLYRPITDRLLGADGLVQRNILTSIDRLLCEHLAVGRASFQAPPIPARLRPTQRYLNTSAMQKAIRRGDTELAMLCAQRSCLDDPTYTFRRLAICAVEDVGIGNLTAVAMALAMLGNKKMREHGATEELAAYIANLLALSPKSRLCCDLISIADYDPSLHHRRHQLAAASEANLRSVAISQTSSRAERVIAAWLLASTARFRGTNMPAIQRDRGSFVQLISEASAPLLFYYLADRTAARLSDAMSVSWHPISEMMVIDPPLKLIAQDWPVPGSIGSFPDYAYDLHTGEGRAALHRFGRECGAVARILASVPAHHRDLAVRHAVFLIEGGLQDRKLSFPAADEVERQAHDVELSCAGLNDALQRDALLAAIATHLPVLNLFRSEIAHRASRALQ